MRDTYEGNADRNHTPTDRPLDSLGAVRKEGGGGRGNLSDTRKLSESWKRREREGRKREGTNVCRFNDGMQSLRRWRGR